MPEAVIVSTARTPIGRAYRGAFNNTHGAVLGGHVIKHAVERARLEPGEVEDVILGCAMPEGATGHNIARQSAIRAGLPVTTAGVTVNRFCSSGLQTIAMAAHRVIVDRVPVVVAGGLESISLVQNEHMNLHRFRETWLEEHKPEIYMSMIETAEVVAKRYYVTRERQDEYALASQQRTAAAQREGRLAAEIVPLPTVKVVQDKATGEVREEEVTLTRDEGNRPDTTLEGLAALKPVAGREGLHHRRERQPAFRRRLGVCGDGCQAGGAARFATAGDLPRLRRCCVRAGRDGHWARLRGAPAARAYRQDRGPDRSLGAQ
jgi:acetyl-CoA C-acetyltransferase